MSEIEILLRMIDEAFDHRSWHGTNLRGSIRGLDVKTVSRRPAAGRHNIWEIVVHAAYWKYVVKRKLLKEKRGSFPLKGSNWFERPAGAADQESQWKSDVYLLGAIHRELRQAVSNLASKDLDVRSKGNETSTLSLITGIAAHDLYHAGQIQLLKRLKSSNV